MTRTIILALAAIGLAPAVLLALANLVMLVFSIFARPVSLSFRLYRKDGSVLDFAPALQLSAGTSLLILLGSIMLFTAIARVRPEVPAEKIKPPPASTSLQ